MEEEEEGEGEGEGLRPGSRCGLDRHLHRARACCRLDSPVVPSRAHLPTPGLAPAALGKALLTCPCPWPCPLVDSYMTAFPGLAPLRDQRQPRSIPSGLQEGAGLLATPGPSSRTQSCLSNHLQDKGQRQPSHASRLYSVWLRDSFWGPKSISRSDVYMSRRQQRPSWLAPQAGLSCIEATKKLPA